MSSVTLVRVNCPDRACARRLAETLVDERLAGCANITGPVSSMYRWQGQRHTTDEYVLWLKTANVVCDRLCVRVAALHPDQAPAILAMECVQADPAYQDWLIEQTQCQ